MKLKPFNEMTNLFDDDEIDALGKYKDMNFKPDIWEYDIPKRYLKNVGANCFILNNFMRNRIKLSPKDEDLAKSKIKLIFRAIEKCPSQRRMILYRGYSNPTKMMQLTKGSVFSEKSFISSTTDKSMAYVFATQESVKIPVISICDYPIGTQMVYIDDDEHEFLLKPHTFKVVKIKIKFINNSYVKVFKLKMVK